ncbi:hypothetical protein [Brachybacterium vulturis]|uniref:hypothetical protein n=1 Tax=Brachybacterium vulturis TaxID=2017484 RepID=UPI00373577D7
MDEVSKRLEAAVWLEGVAPELPKETCERFTEAVVSYYELPAIDGRQRGPIESLKEDYLAFAAILQIMQNEDPLEAISLHPRVAQAELTAWIRGSAALAATDTDLA